MSAFENSWEYQEVLDAAALLQLRRSNLLARLEKPPWPDWVRVVGQGPTLNEQMMRESHEWKHVLSVRQVTTAKDLRVSLPNNRRTLAAGLKMTSLFDWSATTPAARALLAGEPSGVYFFTRAPMQVKILNLREVLLQGPASLHQPCVVAVAEPAAFEAAMRYWHALLKHARPAWVGEGEEGFSARQQHILEMMRQDLTDQAIADVLGVSLRTVRYEVAAVLAGLGVRSRFAAGVALGTAVSEPTG